MTRRTPTLAVLTAALVAGGCVEQQSQPDSMERRQNEALRDPFSYGPTVPNAGAPARLGPPGSAAASDANVNKTQRDDSLKSDWNRFWNP